MVVNSIFCSSGYMLLTFTLTWFPFYLPGLPYRDPTPLLRGTGLAWQYQPDPSLREILTSSLQEHYKNFLDEKFDKTYMPTYLFLAGAGTGKSRNAMEFHQTLISCSLDAELTSRLEKAFVFHVSLENETSLRIEDHFCSIGTRMLLQLLPAMTLDGVLNKYNQPEPSEVFRLVAKHEKKNIKEITGILVIDGIQHFLSMEEDAQNTSSKFYKVLSNIGDLAISNCSFIIPCCTATIVAPFHNLLANTHRKRVYLPVASLNMPHILVEDVPTPIFQDDYISQLLVNDCGGHGRALEALEDALKGYNVRDCNLTDLMNDVRKTLYDRYCEALSISSDEAAAVVRVILLRQRLQSDEVVPGTSKRPDQLAQPGLIRYIDTGGREGFLTAPYIWIWMLSQNASGVKGINPVLQNWNFCDYAEYEAILNWKSPPGAQFWQHFEHFVASFRVLKSIVLEEGKSTSISELHAGARLEGDLKFKNHHLALEIATHQEDTSSTTNCSQSWIVECSNENVDVGKSDHCIVNGVSAPFGDPFLRSDLQVTLRANEVGQWKDFKKAKVTKDMYLAERKKSASDDDFFILYTTDSDCRFNLPDRSGIVDGTNWDDYFGPFAGRAHIFAVTGPVDINNSNRMQLQSVYGMDQRQVNLVIEEREKRKFVSYEDMKVRTGIPSAVVKRFKNPAL